MKIKEAIAEVRKVLRYWLALQNNYDDDHEAVVRVGSAIPVAETLLGALEPKEDRPGVWTSSTPAFEPLPSKLAGRTVDGWGWKLFWKTRDGKLHSETTGRARRGGETLPTDRWLHYEDFQNYRGSRLAFHIFGSRVVAQAWISRSYTPVPADIVIRKVGWRELKEPKESIQTGYTWGHDYELFTAEEIYILPEEGMPICPTPPAERPPEKGDWTVGTEELRMADPKDWPYWSKPHKIERISFYDVANWAQRRVKPKQAVADFGPGFACRLKYLRIVRRAADRLRARDKVKFGSKEGWVYAIDRQSHPISVNFSANRYPKPTDSLGHFNTLDLTLLEPVFDRPAEKQGWIAGECRKCGRTILPSEILDAMPPRGDWLCPDCA